MLNIFDEILAFDFIGEQRRLRRACAVAQSRQNIHSSHTYRRDVNEGHEGSDQILTSSPTR